MEKDHRKETDFVVPRQVELAVNFLMTCPADLTVAQAGVGESIRIIHDWVQTLPKEKVTRS